MNKRLILAIAAASIVIVATGALFFSGALRHDPASETNVTAGAPPAEPVASVEPQLLPVVEAARAAAAQATADAAAADPVAAATDRVAADAAKFAAQGKAASEEAKAVAAKACKAPSERMGCTTAADGTRYEGAQSCRSDGCAPDGFGVFTDPGRGWESQGRWENGSLVLGCDTMKGVITYCGQQVASAWSGYGISYNAKAAAISAEWIKGSGKNPIQLDYPTGSRMRGEMVQYELDGLGVYDRSDKRVLRGRWKAGNLLSGVVTYPGSGEVVSGVFVDGAAQSGSIAYRDGRVFVGEIEDSATMAQAKPRNGVLYAPNGSIEAQGAWGGGAPAAN